jgi:hypothetical protein
MWWPYVQLLARPACLRCCTAFAARKGLFAKTRVLARASLLVLPRTETALERVRHCMFKGQRADSTVKYAALC